MILQTMYLCLWASVAKIALWTKYLASYLDTRTKHPIVNWSPLLHSRSCKPSSNLPCSRCAVSPSFAYFSNTRKMYLMVHITKLQLQTTFSKPLYMPHYACIHWDPGRWKSWYLHLLWPVRYEHTADHGKKPETVSAAAPGSTSWDCCCSGRMGVTNFFLMLSLTLQNWPPYLQPTLDGVRGSNSWEPIWTHLQQIVSLSWTLPWTLACILVLQIMSSPFELFFFLVSNQLIFSPKWQHLHLVSIYYFFYIGPLSKSCGSNLWLLSNKIALFHWTLDPHLKRP